MEASSRQRRTLAATSHIAELVASPVGRCLVRPTFAVWCGAPDLQGSIVWGPLDETAIRELWAANVFIYHRAIADQRCVLTDWRDLDPIEPAVARELIAMARGRVSAWAGGLHRQVVIAPVGQPSQVIAGAVATATADHRLHITGELDVALGLLAHPAAAEAHAAACQLVAARPMPRAGGRVGATSLRAL
jgi:hypothetical protein